MSLSQLSVFTREVFIVRAATRGLAPCTVKFLRWQSTVEFDWTNNGGALEGHQISALEHGTLLHQEIALVGQVLNIQGA